MQEIVYIDFSSIQYWTGAILTYFIISYIAVIDLKGKWYPTDAESVLARFGISLWSWVGLFYFIVVYSILTLIVHLINKFKNKHHKDKHE